MNIPATHLTESQLEKHSEELIEGILGYQLVERQLRMGSYVFDAIAIDKAHTRVIIVELKTCAHIRSLGQLLIYRSALAKALGNGAKDYRVDALLITTFLDLELCDAVAAMNLGFNLDVKVCVDGTDGKQYMLLNPDQAPPQQAWYQSGTQGKPILQSKLKEWLEHE